MDLSHAKAVQIEIMTRLLDYILLPAGHDGYPRFRPNKAWAKRTRLGKKTRLKDIDARRLIGVGISVPARSSRTKGYGILLSCQRKSDLAGPFVRRALELAGGEGRVIYTGLVEQAARKAKKKKQDQPKVLRMGDSVGRLDSAAGSIGCFVGLTGKQGVFVLSNNHVLADNNEGAAADDILSPAPEDNGTPQDDHVADLRTFHPIDLAPDGFNIVDCAVAKVRAGTSIDREMLHGLPGTSGPRKISGQVASVSKDEHVRKIGQTSSGSSGWVLAVSKNVTVFVPISEDESVPVFFSNQIAIDGDGNDFAERGDSGAVVFNDTMDAIGLIFAISPEGGRSGGGVTHCNPMADVLSLLGAEL